MYTLNNISLDDYGFIPSQSDGSNLAITGVWDMPKRMGKTYHDWTDKDGIEPYVAVEDIRFEGRDIQLVGLIRGSSELDAIQKTQSFYDMMDAITDVVTLSCPWGSWKVYVSGMIKARYVGAGTVKITIPFREPKVALVSPPEAPTNLAATNITDVQIDIAWGDVGNEIGYIIERRTDGGAWTEQATVGINVNTYSDTNSIT